MDDPFEWQDYKDKVDELTRKLEELESQVKEDLGKEADDTGPMFTGRSHDMHRREVVMHYVEGLNEIAKGLNGGEEVSVDNYEELRDAFESWVKLCEASGKVEVQQGDMMVGTIGEQELKIYCFVTVADEGSFAGFQNMGPAPYAGSNPWSYHIWSLATQEEEDCSHDHESDETVVTGLETGSIPVALTLTPEHEYCVKYGTETKAEFLKSGTSLKTNPKRLPTNSATTDVPTDFDFSFEATVSTDYTLGNENTYDDVTQPDAFLLAVKTVSVQACVNGVTESLTLYAPAVGNDTVAGHMFTGTTATVRIPKPVVSITATATPVSSTVVTIPLNWSLQDVPYALDESKADAVTMVGASVQMVKSITGSSSATGVTGVGTTAEVAGAKKPCEPEESTTSP